MARMKRLRLILILLAVVVLAGVVLVLVQPTEPKYKGRTLTSYLRGPWKQIDGPQTENPHFAPDEEAIRAIGTNGIPTLLRLIQAHDPPWKAKAIDWLNNQKLVQMDILDARNKRQLGLLGFLLLGDLALPATQNLLELTKNGDPQVRALATGILLHLPVGSKTHFAVIKTALEDEKFPDVSALFVAFETRFQDETKSPEFGKLLDVWKRRMGILTGTNAPAAR